MLDGAGETGIGDTGEGTGAKVLSVGEVGSLAAGVGGVAGLEPSACGVEGAELDGDAGADTNEGSQGALVEGEGTFVFVDGGGSVEGA